MTDGDPDLDGDERALAQMTHGELVALLNRLYVRLDEKRVSTSTALASTDHEVRDTIRAVRRRLYIKLGAPPELLPVHRRPVRELAMDQGDTPPERVFVVLFASDSKLVSGARSACRARGVALVGAASLDLFSALVASVTPTHIVIVGEGFEHEDVAASTILARDLEHRGVRVRMCQDAEQAMQALAEIGT
jgi:hypothetical protein